MIMPLLNKLFLIIIFIVFSPGAIAVGASGLVFDWLPFTTKDYFYISQQEKSDMSGNIYSSRQLWQQYAEGEELKTIDSSLNSEQNKQKIEKSMFSRIKITVSQINSFMLSEDERYSQRKNGNLLQAAGILPSLLKNPSSETALETLKLLQPQINLGFEF